MHISGLENEGRHPRALMESALLLLEQVIGLERPSPRSGSKEAGLPFRHQRIICNLRNPYSLSDSTAVRFIFRQQRPDEASIFVRHRDTRFRYT